MKETLVVMSSNREMEPETRASLKALRKNGAAFLHETGSADVAFARCRALSMACEALRGACHDRSVVVMMDDDIEVELDQVQALVTQARIRKEATAMAYATRNSTLAAMRWDQAPGRWLVGLGCVAIPRRLLLELEQASESFEVMGQAFSAFTWSGPDRGVWVAEDYRLSMRLGGVHLLPIAAGHIKKIALLPDQQTLDEIAGHDAAKVFAQNE